MLYFNAGGQVGGVGRRRVELSEQASRWRVPVGGQVQARLPMAAPQMDASAQAHCAATLWPESGVSRHNWQKLANLAKLAKSEISQDWRIEEGLAVVIEDS